ncbi:hypothetical protein ACXKGW_29715, partial [Klebsiella pneumoniae subsp. pneumoniae]
MFVNGDFTRHLAAFIEEHPDLDLGIACDDLGRALLYRNSRKLSLTQDGTQLLDTARSMLEL